MPTKQKPECVFVERFELNNKKTVDLPYCNARGRTHDKPYSLEDAVVEYTINVFRQCGINIEDITTIKEYEAVGPAISQSALLSQTYYGSVLNRSLDGVRSLMYEVQHATGGN